jgi:myo-inositol-1-phosphate synthase
MSTPPRIAPAKGKLGVLMPGMGAVATTAIAGVEALRLGLTKPYGSLTQLSTIRLGKKRENRTPLIKDFVPLAALDDLVFGGWDIYADNAFEAATRARVIEPHHLAPLRAALERIRPMPAAFDQNYVKRISGPNVKKGTRRDLADQLIADIASFKRENGCDRLVMIWCGSTESYLPRGPAHASLRAFEAALDADDHSIAPSMLYAYAAMRSHVPFINGAPNLSGDIPALFELSRENHVPQAGKDFKTGQTLMKTILAPGLKARMLGLNGWFSTNILGNRDGEVLDDPGSFKTKELSKLSVLDTILQPEMYPDLYGNISHKVSIHYYPPRGDNKEGWDNIDIVGWMGYPMQIKVNFLCRDSILAAPLVLDLALLIDLAARAGMRGPQEWLSFYFKSPIHPDGGKPEHDLFIQQTKLKNTLRLIRGEQPVTHVDED